MIVQIPEGKLRGLEKKSVLSDRLFWTFLGIPYAKPPIGDLRFKAPEPFEQWEGVLDAWSEKSQCMQMEGLTWRQRMAGSEDCLYLNVYTPNLYAVGSKKMAVMVFIHGGSFYGDSGASKMYGPDFLMEQNVVYVSFNYRLHVFGFMNTNTEGCPGNAGLKDQVLALKWVKKNIAKFGGDPENITLFGESAGATCVHLHMLSPLSKGLFHKAILQSGTALSSWAIQKKPDVQARRIGLLANYNELDLKGLVNHLREQPAKKLCEYANKLLQDAIKETPGRCIENIVFYPSVERIKEGAFLPDLPEKLMETAPAIPTIFGFNDQEGLLEFIEKPRNVIDSLLADLSIVVKENFRLENAKQQTEMVSKIKEFYFKNETPTVKQPAPFVNLFTDLLFLKFHQAMDHLIRDNVPPYVYLFAYEGQMNFMKQMVQTLADVSSIKGAAHADDLGYLFKQSATPAKILEADKRVIKNLSTLWTNFAKTGQPTSSLPDVDWKPNTVSEPSYIRIEQELQVFNEKLFGERFDFWKDWETKFLL